jgi:hypothetical protein
MSNSVFTGMYSNQPEPNVFTIEDAARLYQSAIQPTFEEDYIKALIEIGAMIKMKMRFCNLTLSSVSHNAKEVMSTLKSRGFTVIIDSSTYSHPVIVVSGWFEYEGGYLHTPEGNKLQVLHSQAKLEK